MAGPLGGATGSSQFEEDVYDRPPRGCCREVRQRPPPSLKKTSMEGHLGVLSAGPAAATTEFEEDIDGGPPRGCCQ
jgi:hypothetical protein